jgi:hypothetical protein
MTEDAPDEDFPVKTNVTLGELLRELKDRFGTSLRKLTVMSKTTDPFRLDTPAYHEAGKWFRDMMARAGVLGRKIHNRGIHYAIAMLESPKPCLPSGERFLNNDVGWAFIEDKASKAARWLGYVPFDNITDERNAEPIIRIREVEGMDYTLRTASASDLPIFGDLGPTVVASCVVRQLYLLVIWGEKTSLREVADPISERFNTDLFLGTGEASDTHLYLMAEAGAKDGREMIVFLLTDCDPSGFQMGVSVGHKLRAFKEAFFPNLRFRVIHVALTIDQVKSMGLPSTPLKDTEKRAAGWFRRYGVEQTEIDALATLRPQVLRQLLIDAIMPFYDDTLDYRVSEAGERWQEQAQAELDRLVEEAGAGDLRDAAEASLRDADQALRDFEGAVAAIHFVPPPDDDLPEPQPSGEPKPSLVDSDMTLIEHIERLRDRKDYSNNGEDEE